MYQSGNHCKNRWGPVRVIGWEIAGRTCEKVNGKRGEEVGQHVGKVMAEK